MRRILIIGALLVVTAGAFIGWEFYTWIYSPNTREGKSQVLLIPQGSDFHSVLDSLLRNEMLINRKSFEWVAQRMEFGDKSIKTGRYGIDPGMSNYALIQKLRLGQQTPVNLVINSAHTLERFVSMVDRQLEMDSLTLLMYLRDTYLPASKFTEANILSLFIPNTYEIWWNTSPEKLMARMESEYEKFWTEERRAAADRLALKPSEIYTLASIVEAETQAKEERKTIAGVYLNRLKQNIPLQADPTIRFALRDDSIRRILHEHLNIDSPYNTYRNTGLPPGPIGMPSINSIDAVLYPEDHNYMFFCARPGYDGRHLFAETYNAHLVNARKYQKWLNEEGIR